MRPKSAASAPPQPAPTSARPASQPAMGVARPSQPAAADAPPLPVTGSRSLNWRPPGEQSDGASEKNGANGVEHAPAPTSVARDEVVDQADAAPADKTDATLVEEPKPAVAQSESDKIPFDEEAAKPKRRFLSFGRGR
jgi:hypothetical protein